MRSHDKLFMRIYLAFSIEHMRIRREKGGKMAKLLYQGHGSYRVVADDGTVIYVDPYMGGGYNLPADLALVTHEHHDHNKLSLLTFKPDGKIFRGKDMTDGTTYRRASFKGISVEAVPAYNKNHPVTECVGFIISVDGITIYASGDTSETEYMHDLASRNIDYALLPTDGIYNMDAEEASECAAIIRAKHSVPIHTKPETPFDKSVADKFHCEGKLVLEPGDEIIL